MIKDLTFRRVASFALVLTSIVMASSFAAGCADENNRTPTKEEGAAADAKRQAYIDSLNISPEQKARMKAQMGGPAVPSPADAARNGAKPPGGR